MRHPPPVRCCGRQRRAAGGLSLSEPPLPPGEIGGGAAWRGEALRASSNLVHEFREPELAEIDAALAEHRASGRSMAQISPQTFHLPGLSKTLAGLLEEILHGRGFALLRGFPVDRYELSDVAAAYLGVGSHLGSFRSQNAKGHLLGHVRSLGLDIADRNTRYYQTDRELDFHTDSADIVGLVCLQQARSGGQSRLVSSVTLHDEIYRRRPDLWRQLFNAFPVDRRGEVPAGMRPWFEVPVFNWHAGRLTTMYVGQYIRSAQANFPAARRLTPLEIEALDYLDALCDDPALHYSMRLQPGDMQFVYNHHLLHARTDFEDWPEPGRRRHLLRLWLSPAGDRPLPPCFAQRYGSLTAGNRGGIITPRTELTFSLDP